MRSNLATMMLAALLLASPMVLAQQPSSPVATAGQAGATASPQPTSQPAVEQPAAEAVKSATQQATSVVAGFKGGKYREAIAGLITLLVFGWRRFGSRFLMDKLSPPMVAFVAAAMGFLGTLPEALATQPFSLWAFAFNGLATSAEAIFFWEMAGQHILPKVFGSKPAVPPA